MSTPVQTRLEDAELERLDAAIARGRFSSRSEALRTALTLALDAEREREIVAAYEHGYGEHPQEEWTGELGLSLLAAAAAAEERGRKPL